MAKEIFVSIYGLLMQMLLQLAWPLGGQGFHHDDISRRFICDGEVADLYDLLDFFARMV